MASELLASLQDINGWFTDDKLVADSINTAQLQIDAQRLIRGQLASSFTPTVLSSWLTPATTPGLIRAIAGRLIAAFLYRKIYSEEGVQIPAYAQEIYNEAIQMLIDIRMGNLTVTDDDGNPITGNTEALSSADFFPNNSADPPYFTMADKFG